MVGEINCSLVDLDQTNSISKSLMSMDRDDHWDRFGQMLLGDN